MSYPKAMLSQLTDLDDSELDEQAGVFGYRPNRKEGLAPPSPKLFFNPTSVFLDVPDYRDTVSLSKRFTHLPNISTVNAQSNQNQALAMTNGNSTNHEEKAQNENNHNTDHRGNVNGIVGAAGLISPNTLGLNQSMNLNNQLGSFLSNPKGNRSSERRLSIETSETNADEASNMEEQSDSKAKRLFKAKKLINLSQPRLHRIEPKSNISSNHVSNLTSRHPSDSESYVDSDDHEEYMYNMGKRQQKAYSPPFKGKNHNDFQEYDTDTDGYYNYETYQDQSLYKARNYSKNQCHHPKENDSNAYEVVFDESRHQHKTPKRKSSHLQAKDLKHYGSFQKSLGHRYTPDPSHPKMKRSYIHGPIQRGHYFDEYSGSDSDTLPLVFMRTGAPYRRRRHWASELSIVTILLILTALSCFMALYSMSTIPLADVSLVLVNNVLAAENELVFDIHVKASNWNWWSIYVNHASLGVYATPIPPKCNDTGPGLLLNSDTKLALLLGNVTELQEPLVYPGNWIWQRRDNPITLSSSVILVNPGHDLNQPNKTNPWYNILKGTYDLTVRGSLRYNLLNTKQVARICAIQRIGPEEHEGVGMTSNVPLGPAVSCVDDDEPIF